ncbi:unnamed protein product, partial [Meganyctiphanes norvegica]
MGEYATLFALHKIYEVSSVILPIIKQRLSCFPNLTLPDIPKSYERADWTPVKNIGKIYNYAPIELAAAGLLGPKLFVMREYPFEIQLFHAVREDVVKQFAFSPEIQRQANDHINKILEILKIADQSLNNNDKEMISHQGLFNDTSQMSELDVTIIGFHIRRTDYANHTKNMFGATLPESAYFNQALEYYRKKHKRPIFIVASDDYDYVKTKL